jgi:hypothetical protein
MRIKKIEGGLRIKLGRKRKEGKSLGKSLGK